MARDTETHGRKTVAGIDFTFGATTRTPCGKTRKRQWTSTDPDVVTCRACRAWFAAEETHMAGMAEAAARIQRDYPDVMSSGMTEQDFRDLAATHRAKAEKWRLDAPGKA